MFRRTLCAWGMGIGAAASLPDAGFTDFTWELTPWTFPLFALCIGGLYELIRQSTTRGQAALYSFLWSFGYFVMGLNWVGNALLVDGNPYAWAYPFALIGLPLILSPLLTLAMALVQPRLHTASPNRSVLLFVIAFAAAEWARGHFFTGFPWILPGQYWVNIPGIIQSASVVGIYGTTFLTLLWSAAFFVFIKHLGERQRSLTSYSIPLSALLLFAICMVYGMNRVQNFARATPQYDFQVVLVQPNIPQSEKWDSSKMREHFFSHLYLSMPPSPLDPLPTAIIWPETALHPALADRSDIARQIGGLLRLYPKNSYLLTGALRAEKSGTNWSFRNSLLVYDQGGQIIDSYDKSHLVPFGEYMPFQRWIPIGPIAQFEGLVAGSGPTTLTIPNLPAFSPLICYEVIFPGAITARPPAPPPRWIVNVTNDSWYGHSAGPLQHLAQARIRAIEEGIPVIRAASTGISAAINPWGGNIVALSYNSRDAKLMKVATYDHIKSLYPKIKDWPFLFMLVLPLVFIIGRPILKIS